MDPDYPVLFVLVLLIAQIFWSILVLFYVRQGANDIERIREALTKA